MRALITYVRRARALFLALGSGEGEDVYLNLASEFGDAADFSILLTRQIVVVEHAFHAAAAVSWRTLERSAVRMAVVAMRPALVR